MGIQYSLLPETKDVWAVDYMPIQIRKDHFVQILIQSRLTYNRRSIGEPISDVDSICKTIGIKTQKSELIVDGGNISKEADKVIMCDKVFYENRHLSEKEVIKKLRQLFEVDNLYFVPWDINDYTGHSDGMVRFIDDKTVLINDYSKEDKLFQRSFRNVLAQRWT